MNISLTTLAQYVLAALALVALVVLNLYGTSDPALTTALVGVVTGTVWGGIQREAGIKAGSSGNTKDPAA